MKLTMPSGMEITVWVTHKTEPVLKNGHEVWVKKQRKIKIRNEEGKTVDRRFETVYEVQEKRSTEVEIFFPAYNDTYSVLGVAKVHPLDQFNKKEGRRLALEDALDYICEVFPTVYDELGKEGRKALFDAVVLGKRPATIR